MASDSPVAEARFSDVEREIIGEALETVELWQRYFALAKRGEPYGSRRVAKELGISRDQAEAMIARHKGMRVRPYYPRGKRKLAATIPAA